MHTCEKENKDVRMSPYRIRKAKLRYSDEPNKFRSNKAIRFNRNKVQPQKDISIDMYAMWVTQKRKLRQQRVKISSQIILLIFINPRGVS